MSSPSSVVPVVAMATATTDGDGHDQCDDGRHDDEADGCRQYDSCLEHVAVLGGCRGNSCGTRLSLVTYICSCE